MPEPSGRRLQSLLALIADCERALPALKRELQACANDDPPVCVRTRIAGVGSISALLVIAELGEVSRVPSCRHLASWAGRTPGVRNSGEQVRLGSISQQGSAHLRWGLIQAAQTAVQADGPLKTSDERIKRRRSPSSPSPARSSPSVTTAFATARSAVSKQRLPGRSRQSLWPPLAGRLVD